MNNFSGKKIALLGFGISNQALYKYLRGKNCKLIDIYDERASEIDDFDVLFFNELKNNVLKYDVLFRTPGIRPDIEELKIAKENNIKISSEIELLFELVDCSIIGITGSDGKSTTTKIVFEILKKSNKNVYLGGNIGNPLIEYVDEIKKTDYLVIELSSFQLMSLSKSPNRAIITNITPNHLDYHKDFNEYVKAKTNIFKNQSKNGVVIINKNDKISMQIAKNIKNEIRFINDQTSFHIDKENIYYKKTKILRINDIIIPGRHNIDNYMCAIASLYDLVSNETIKKTAQEFKGLEHRQEVFLKKDDIIYINDSIASSPNRTITGLEIFDKKVILIAGGKDKKIPYDEIGKPVSKHVKYLILVGQTSKQIYKSVRKVDKNIKIDFAYDLEDAAIKAKQYAKRGDIVYFSPASTSFDMFKNFDERGKTFKEIIKRIVI